MEAHVGMSIRRLLLATPFACAAVFLLAIITAGAAETAGSAASVHVAGLVSAGIARFDADPGSPDNHDITVQLDAPGFALRHLVHTQGDPGATTTKLTVPLAENRDYIRDGDLYTFRKTYLEKLPSEVHEFTFILNGDGNHDPAFQIEVVDSSLVAAMAMGGELVASEYVGVPGGWWRNPFSDIALDDWFYDDVSFVCSYGLFNGVRDGAFGPDEPMTRAMLMSVLYRYAGSPDTAGMAFADLMADEYYVGPVEWAAASGIAHGAQELLFEPDAPVTRQELVAFLHRFAAHIGVDFGPAARGAQSSQSSQYTQSSGGYPQFADGDLIEGYAMDAIQALCGAGILLGSGGGRIDPLGLASRAEVAAVMHRFISCVAAMQV